MTMKFLLPIILFAQILFAQQTSNNLEGSFKNKSKNSIYTTLNFDGRGKVNINDMQEYDFFERNDSVIAFVDNVPFIFKKKNNQLVGQGEWINNEVFKSSSKTLMYNQDNDMKLAQRAKWLERHYELNYKIGLNLFALAEGEDDLNQKIENLLIENTKLCNEGFDLGCIQQFSQEIMADMGGISLALQGQGNSSFVPNKKYEELGNKVIQLGNPEGYGLLSSYFYMINESEKAKEINDKGLEEGCVMCLELAMNDLLRQIEQEDIE
ncbi:hypothetical protein IM532_12550 [Faecalibacter sp. WQ 117]|uniref:Sel1 repeat family protein n=2 Tax=Faecalibacter rhinopitheci TaxID=2779678 RepID=A0A8J7FR22_9FLAO|nr:hypothetical protein [Faecalibacter rhinopitheci]